MLSGALLAELATSTGPRPTVALLIPVFDGGSSFQRCLAAVRALSPAPDELIVVNDGSADGSAEMAAAAGARVLSLPVRGGPAAARNVAARAASSAILLFLDSDVIPAADLVGRVRAAFHSAPAVSAVFGSYDDAPDANDFISQYKNLFHHFVHQRSAAEASTFWTGCGAVRRDAFVWAGGFDESYRRPCVEDIELGYRLRAGGHRIQLLPGLQVKHLKAWTALSQLRVDLFDRAVPWSELILKGGKLGSDLNLGHASRAAVVLAAAALVLLACAPWSRAALVGGALALGAQIALDLPLWHFFRERRGRRFALRAILWHRLYHWLCGFGFAAALVRFCLSRAPSVPRDLVRETPP